ncbi:hypothetical protein [Sinomonas atrocyanea]|uniref:hypothetical protein n=1 Tax=Sinomonas atrocyanea TaxID=37927 RepID=UPI002861C68E|nr:hypothetical protein [Sinomonas atrocyanea]MDR6623046.1 hypothetical protein [Sinomonas atrocyanea]
MIIVQTEYGALPFDADPTDVEQKAATLIINRDGQPIAKFRTWLSWHEAPADQNETH